MAGNASRRNGAKGAKHGVKGAKHGIKGGRPRKSAGSAKTISIIDETSAFNGAAREYAALIRELGELPKDPLRRAEWIQELNCRALQQTLLGHASEDLNEEIRSFSRIVIASIPRERLMVAEEAVRADAKRLTKKPRATGMKLTAPPPGSKPVR